MISFTPTNNVKKHGLIIPIFSDEETKEVKGLLTNTMGKSLNSRARI